MDDKVAAVEAIRTGDVEALERILQQTPDLVNARVDGQRTLLHVATDWPGHFPRNVESVRTLIAHGADVNARFLGRHSETPLHWAASCNDTAVLDVLLDAGADIEASGGVVGGGAPLADAVAFGQWNAARRLVERGAKTTLWQAAALGLMSRVRAFFESDPIPRADEVTNALWCACHGGQRDAAEYLLDRGADIHWIGHDGLTPLQAAERSNAKDLVEWLRHYRA
ncbi:MAG TPA: ankyrin repeat domain-containing protein [Bryobacteraceae bacterium]|nr:ankyrin repeat domain-containing protein [Bryobacteraceae bacterium]